MIGRLRGIVANIEEDCVLLDVSGVGYEVFTHARLLAALKENEAATLIIETHVREDHFHLFGFATREERDWFRLLASVQRVGNRMALLILSAYAPAQVMRAIVAKDTSAFSRLSGIGPKLAERIVAELKDKAIKLPTGPMELPAAAGHKKSKGASAEAPSSPDAAALADTISALEHLGYSRGDSYAAAVQAAREVGEDANVDTLIRKSLKELAP